MKFVYLLVALMALPLLSGCAIFSHWGSEHPQPLCANDESVQVQVIPPEEDELSPVGKGDFVDLVTAVETTDPVVMKFYREACLQAGNKEMPLTNPLGRVHGKTSFLDVWFNADHEVETRGLQSEIKPETSAAFFRWLLSQPGL